ncbi:M23 family metallopeptidase [Neisseria shayeganii]|uniref:M23 peptidase domain protein n=1 Tax=Neisseria shayeganii 871 TaxID=1032488 RepID=G4CG20_9NEIS|nr:M23 family metallopeptidase [Neisseria shayeganii]EGY53261.1 M23 peptidase domain protein [Neisseria shayeganii 871]
MTDSPSIWRRRRVRLALLAAVLPFSGIVAAYALTEPPAAVPAHESKRVLETLPSVYVRGTPPAASYWRDEVVQAGDNLSLVLGRFGIDERHIQNILRESPIDTKLLQLRPDQVISMQIDTRGNPTHVQFFNDDDNGERNLIALELADGHWRAQVGEVQTETMPSLKAVVIKSSLTGSLAQAGIPVEVRESLKEIFSDSLDLSKLERGDTVRVLYDSMYFRGQELATGDILSAEITHKGELYRAYYFGEDGGGQYYDAKGQPLKKGFETQPVAGSRISSPYGLRIHPVLGGLRMHTGIDYAAPTGTPIRAPSAGVVEFRGWKGGYGNTVVLRHNSSMETLYAHMSAFSTTAAPGMRVAAGEIIGYVGSTGRSTGPHLHYEVRLNGQPVNPVAVALPAKKLNAQELAKFRQTQAHLEATLSPLRHVGQTIAQVD